MMIAVKVSGMSCGHCVKAATAAIQAADPTAQVTVSLEAGLVQAQTRLSESEVAALLAEEGFPQAK